jgi:hypothetical protein
VDGGRARVRNRWRDGDGDVDADSGGGAAGGAGGGPVRVVQPIVLNVGTPPQVREALVRGRHRGRGRLDGDTQWLS